MKLAAMNRILVPAVAGVLAARLGINLLAVTPDQGPLSSGDADLVEVIFPDTQIVQFTNGVGLEVYADTERLDLGHTLKHHTIDADLVEGKCQRQSA